MMVRGTSPHTQRGHLSMVGGKPLFKQVLIFSRFIGGDTQFFNILHKELSTYRLSLSYFSRDDVNHSSASPSRLTATKPMPIPSVSPLKIFIKN